jgi:hypothetical protein
VLWTIVLVLIGGLALFWYGVAERPEDALAELPADVPGGTGTAGERTPAPGGATSGPTAVGDTDYFVVPDGAHAGAIVGTYDRQTLYLVDPQPVEMPDSRMVLEERANELTERPARRLYVPAAAEGTDTAATRFYYLKVGEDRYVKVSLRPPAPDTPRMP